MGVTAQAKAAAGTRKRQPVKARILLVDDDERNLLALSEVLEDTAEVVTATSGREALRALLSGDFAVILLDVFMPEMDGYETASLIRERDQTSRIPIIFLSAVNKETEHLMRGYAMGAVDYVFKPVEPLVLKSKVSVFVDLYDMRRQVEIKSRAEQQLRDANYRAELEKMQMGRELETSRKREAAIIHSLPIVLYMESPENDPRCPDFVSGNLAELTGFTIDQIKAEPKIWQDRIHPDDRDRVLAAIAERQSSGRFSIEYRWQCSDGSFKHFHDQAVLLRGGGEAGEFAGTLTDVSEQRLLENKLVQAGKMEAIGQLTGGVAHDFNNLLAAVLGGIHLLERRVSFGEREQKIIDQMRHASEQGAELVRRMMAFARRQELTPASVDPASLCEAVSGLVEHTLGGTIEIDWQCVQRKSNLFVDQSQLELALLNLILNARDAMPGGGMVIVRIGEPDQAPAEMGKDCLSIRVTDQGAGIPPEHISRITEPFFTTKESGKGTGLGLSMVVGFVQQSGGQLNIDSAMGQGTTVEMILPATPQPPAARLPKDSVDSSAITVQRILLVDDDDAVRTVLGEQLREMGLSVEEAVDGKSAIERLKQGQRFDFMLTDFAMPGLNGLETIRRAVKQAPAMRAALMTGYADEESTAEARELVTILRKPIEMRDLLVALS